MRPASARTVTRRRDRPGGRSAGGGRARIAGILDAAPDRHGADANAGLSKVVRVPRHDADPNRGPRTPSGALSAPTHRPRRAGVGALLNQDRQF